MSEVKTGSPEAEALVNEVTELRGRVKELEELVTTDELTGALNRRGFNQEVEKHLTLAQRKGQPLALLFVDLNNFKKLNDTYGHLFGDEVLKVFAAGLIDGVRDSDYVARIGGDEFAVIMPMTGREVEVVSERIERRLKGLTVKFGQDQAEIEASYGFAIYPDNADSLEKLLSLADAFMYRRKHG